MKCVKGLITPSSLSRTLTTTSNNRAWFFAKEKEKTSGHSSLLSKDQSVYEMVTDTVIPREWDVYLGNKRKLVECAQQNNGNKYLELDAFVVPVLDNLYIQGSTSRELDHSDGRHSLQSISFVQV